MFIVTEDGLGTLEVPHFPLATSFAEVMEALYALYNEPHEFGTVVIDSVDWLEPLIWSGSATTTSGARSRSRATARAMSRRSISGASTSTA